MSEKKKTTKKAAKPAATKKTPKKVEKAPEKKDPGYEIKTWNKLDMFQCTRCPWSTLDEDEMLKHVHKHTSSTAPSVRRTDTGFVTVTGDKIIREEIIPPSEDEQGG